MLTHSDVSRYARRENPSVASRQLPLGQGSRPSLTKNRIVMRKTSLPLEGKGDHAVVDEVARAKLARMKLLATLEVRRPLPRATPHQSLRASFVSGEANVSYAPSDYIQRRSPETRRRRISHCEAIFHIRRIFHKFPTGIYFTA